MRTSRSAFTLVELLVVIAVIVILMGMLFPAISIVRNHMKKAQVTALLREVQAGLEVVRTTTGHYPEPSPITYAQNGAQLSAIGLTNFALLRDTLRTANRDLFGDGAKAVVNGEIRDIYGTPLRYVPAAQYPPIINSTVTSTSTYPDVIPNPDSYLLWSAGPNKVDDATVSGRFASMPVGGGDDLFTWGK